MINQGIDPFKQLKVKLRTYAHEFFRILVRSLLEEFFI
jgi:hypothetical protein